MAGLAAFHLLRPETLDEAATLLAHTPHARILGGGTDLIPNGRRGLVAAGAFIDLAGIAELKTLICHPAGLSIGAGVTLAQLAADPEVAARYPILVEAALAVAGPGHREVATVGGNLCLDTRCVFYNQSEWWRHSNGYCLKHQGETCHVAPTGKRCHAAFSGDLAPALLALDADIDLVSAAECRTIKLAELYHEDGAAHLRLEPGEILASVALRATPGLRAAYAKVRLRDAIDFPLAGVAVALTRDGDRLSSLRVALTGTNARPFLLAGTAEFEGSPLDAAALQTLDRLVQRQVSPMRTTIAPAHYRRRVAAALTKRLVAALWG
jgi:4-hydroxybenzoyl-CoA reductase subunit beta